MWHTATALARKHGLYMPPQISPAGPGPPVVGASPVGQADGNGLEAFGLSLITIAAAMSKRVCKWSPWWYECLSVVPSCFRPVP